jgi:hypothetical protein
VNHVGEAAELQALGLLGPQERAALERHGAGCSECLRRLGLAEERAARLASALPWAEPSNDFMQRLHDLPRVLAVERASMPAEPTGAGAEEPLGRAQRMALRWAEERKRSAGLRLRAYLAGLAVAALAAGLVFALSHGSESDATLRGDELTMSALAHGAFGQVPLVAGTEPAPDGRVLYAKDGSWIFVLVEGSAGRLHLALSAPGGLRDFGPLLQRPGVATLFVPSAHRPLRVSLRDGSTDVASAEPKYDGR